MKIYILRHGDYLSASQDPSEGLSSRGKKQAQEVAKKLKGHSFQKIFSSPKTRAKQTAHIIAQDLGMEVEEKDALKGGSSVEEVLKILPDSDVLLVSHLPLVAEIAMALTGQKVPFFHCTLVCIETENPHASTGALVNI